MVNTNTGDAALDANTRGLLDMIKQLQDVALLRGRLIAGVELANAADVDIQHLLGRSWQGWIVVDTTGAAAAGRIDGTTAAYDASTLLRLRATGYGATITVALWVF